MWKIIGMLVVLSGLSASCTVNNDPASFRSHADYRGISVGYRSVQGKFCPPGKALKGYCWILGGSAALESQITHLRCATLLSNEYRQILVSVVALSWAVDILFTQAHPWSCIQLNALACSFPSRFFSQNPLAMASYQSIIKWAILFCFGITPCARAKTRPATRLKFSKASSVKRSRSSLEAYERNLSLWRCRHLMRMTCIKWQPPIFCDGVYVSEAPIYSRQSG